MTPSILWLAAGAFFIAVEMVGMPGIGFLFAGIGALVVGALVEANILEPSAQIPQFVIFFAITVITAALLWKRLKRRTPGAAKYHNMIGTEAIVADGGLTGGQIGQVKWSGTLMRARLVEGMALDVAPEGSVVIIRQVEGNVLFVAPKQH